MMEAKGVYILLEACQLLKAKGLSFECHFVGDWADVNENSFNAQVNKLGLTQNVIAHGKKYGGDKLKYFTTADVFIFPTYYHNECFPLVLVEAMQFGLPIISTPEGGIRDIVEHGQTGFLVVQKDAKTLAEKIEILIQQPEFRKKMGAEGRIRYEGLFTLRKFETKLNRILKKAIAS